MTCRVEIEISVNQCGLVFSLVHNKRFVPRSRVELGFAAPTLPIAFVICTLLSPTRARYHSFGFTRDTSTVNMRNLSAARLIAAYLVFQAIAVGIWWLVLFTVPASVAVFQPAHWPAESLLSFCLADIGVVIIGSLVAAYATATHKKWASVIVWVLAGAISYAALYCVSASMFTGDAWLASALMVIMAGVTISMATMFGAESTPELFRTRSKPVVAAVGWTAFQTVIFWSVFLWIIPNGIDDLMGQLVEKFGFFTPQRSLGISLFLIASALGIWSGMTMAVIGQGTPLPTSNAPTLVITGPYRFLRNPMALAGILQGIAVGTCTGSIWVILYAIVGGVLWHFTVRNFEEQELLIRFGEPYQTYCNRVGLWLPRLLNWPK